MSSVLDRLDRLRQEQAQLDQFESTLVPDERGLTRKSVGVGVDQLQGSLAGGLAAGADVLGADRVKDVLVDSMVDNNAQAAQDSQGVVTTLDQATSVGDYAEWALFNIASQAPNMATMIGLGAVTGGVGAVGARAAATAALQKQIGSTAAKHVAAGMTKQAALKAATQSVTSTAARTGQIAGFSVPSMQLSTGEIYGSIDRETGKTDESVKAAVAGSVAGLLDAAPLFRFTQLAGVSTDVVKNGILANVKKAGYEAIKQAGAEGATEAMQTVIEHAAVDWVEGNLELFTEERLDEILNAAASGALIGGLMGGAGSAIGSARTPPEADPTAAKYLDPDQNLPAIIPDEVRNAIDQTVKSRQSDIREQAQYHATIGDQAALINARRQIRELEERAEKIRQLPGPEENQLYDGEGPDIDLGLKTVQPVRDSELTDGNIIYAGNGRPWKTEKAAQRALTKQAKESEYQVVQNKGGYALELIKQATRAKTKADAEISTKEVVRSDEAANVKTKTPKIDKDQLGIPAILREKKQTDKSAVGPRKLTPKERAAQRRKVNPATDDLLTAVSKLGGLATDIENDFKGRLSHIKTPVGMPNLERPQERGGRTLDDLAEQLLELGYLIATDVGNGVDQAKLADLLEKAAAGERIMSLEAQIEDYAAPKELDVRDPEDFMAAYPEFETSYLEEDARAALPAEYYAPDIVTNDRVLTELMADLEGMGIPSDALDRLVEGLAIEGLDTPSIMRELFILAEERRLEQETKRGGTGRGEASQDDELLNSYSQEEVTEREKANRDADQAKADEQKRVEQQDTADDFVLTGSDSEADKAAARGQQDMLTSEPESKPAPDLNTAEGLIQAAIAGGIKSPEGIRSFVNGQNQVAAKLGSDAINVTDAQIQQALGQQITEDANEAATSPTNDLPEPTDAQKEAGNYKVGKIKVHGMDVSIENPKGSYRRGTDKDGKEWKVLMKHHYGYIKQSEAVDGDHVDVFVNPVGANNKRLQAYVIDQVDLDGKYDEPKVMIGFRR